MNKKYNNNIQGIFGSVVSLVYGRFTPLYTKETTLPKTPDVERYVNEPKEGL